jgi:CHASE2 domain-containing sensor protein
VLPVTRAAQSAATTPLQSLASEAAALGHTQMPVDSDGVVRRFYAQEGKAGQLWWHMALSLHCVGQTTALPTICPNPCRRWFRQLHGSCRQRSSSLLPGQAGPPEQPGLAVHHLLLYRHPARQYPGVAFRGKYVLIGATAAGLGEKFTAPIGFDARLISNVEMLGHVLNGILQDTHLEPASATLNRSLNVLPVLLGLLALAWLGPSGGLISSILLALLSLSIAGLAPRWGHVQTAPAAALLSLSLAYPLWSWLRLRAATRFLALELRDLQGQGLPRPRSKRCTRSAD